jgi:hypothetical protein
MRCHCYTNSAGMHNNIHAADARFVCLFYAGVTMDSLRVVFGQGKRTTIKHMRAALDVVDAIVVANNRPATAPFLKELERVANKEFKQVTSLGTSTLKVYRAFMTYLKENKYPFDAPSEQDRSYYSLKAGFEVAGIAFRIAK